MEPRVHVLLNIVAAFAAFAVVGGVAMLIAGMTTPDIVALVGAAFAVVGWRMARRAMAQFAEPA